MELKHLLQLVSELPQNTKLNYVRGSDECKFINVDIDGERINSETPTGESKSWAPTYLAELASKIVENEPFNLSGLLNNKGSFRPVLESIIAHTREFYTVRIGTATALVWIPSNPKINLGLEEIIKDNIPSVPKQQISVDTIIINPKKKSLSTEALAKELSRLYNSLDSKTTGIHLFGLKYGHLINNRNIKEIIQLSGLNDSYIQELNKMIRLYSAIKSNVDGVCFYDDVKDFLSTESVKYAESKMDLSYLRAMRTKPFLLLAGISGTGKSRIVKQMAFDCCPNDATLRRDPTSPGNYCLIEVKPNWHDSSELIGYESRINGDHYVVTPFIYFLIKAMHYPEVPFFLCLDEMNLAPVEQYFAEFLSVLESRKLVNGKITSEPIIKPEIFGHYFNDFKAEYFNRALAPGGLVPEKYAELWKEMGDNGLRIPSNLIVIGTVNMDETTHQFSRKVIDRAMTIEMNLPEGEPFLDFFNNARDLEYTDTPFSADLFLPSIVKAADAVEALAENNAEQTEWLKKEVATILTGLNAALEDTPFKIAYRVQNELMLYFYEFWKENGDADWHDILNESVDQILMMKVLPRVEGDEDLLEKPLASLANFCATGNYRKAAQKVAEMKNRLDRAHFTSYWP